MPEAIASALVTYGGFSAPVATFTAYAIVIAGTVAYSDYARRKANARARAAANASAKDRELMIRSAIAPRRYIYGQDRVSGPIFYMQATGDKSQYLHLCIALAAHECESIETVYFNEDPLPAEDGSGYVQTGDYVRPGRTQTTGHTGTTNASGEITLPHDAVEVLTVYTESGNGDSYTQTQLDGYSHTTGTDTVTGLPADTALVVQYTYQEAATPLVRIRKFLGTASQTADADLVTESGGLWTTDHRARGVCYLYVRLEYDQDVFGSVGVPNISAVVKGKKVYDPRTTLTAWSDNAALYVADWLQSAEGMQADAAEVPDAEVITAANICDEEIDLDLGGTTTQLRYTCNTSFTTQQSPRDVLGEMLGSMAGRAVWTQGRWLVRAGAYRTPALTITADMLAGPVQITPRAQRGEVFNAVRATHRDEDQNWAEVQAPLVENASYQTSDGGTQIVRQIDIPTLADTYRAQRLAKIELERARQALTVRITCNLQAYDLAPTDTVMLTLSTYGFSSKVFEVLERTLGTDGLLQYTLRETASGVWDWNYGEATVGDLAPNTDLPSPFGQPGAITGLTATEQIVRMGDGTRYSQALLEWDQSDSPFVVSGGRIEVQTARAGAPFGSMSLPGDATSVVQGPLEAGMAYIGRVRAVTADNKAGDWAYVTLVASQLTTGYIRLTTDRFPFFSFADGTTHTAQAPGDGTITITAQLVSLSGTPVFTATAKNSGGGTIGSVTLGGSGLVRTLTAAQFVAPGTSGSVRTVEITATLGGVSDTLIVYRQDSTTTAPRLYLSNPTATVPTDENGDFGDYADAETDVKVYAGLTDATSSWSFAITPDSGVTATINGGAGPVTGTGTVTVAVSDMTIPDGAVLITASKVAESDLTDSFYVTKNEGGSGAYQAYWDPRAEIVLPLGAGGEVSSYADAYSSLVITRAGGIDDSANWTFARTDRNVVSTITANLVQVTDVLELGTVGTVTYTDISATLPSGWTRPQKILRTADGWVALGFHASVNYSKVQTSDDFSTWSTVDVGASKLWYDGAADGDTVIAVGMGAVSADLVRSTDGGATWTTDSYGTSMQANAVAFLGSHFVISQVSGTGGRISTDGDTWSSITMPGNSCKLWGWTGRWFAETSSGAWYYSSNAGSSWALCTGLPATLSSHGAVVFAGRAIILPNTGSSTSTFYFTDVTENGGNAWAAGSLAQATNGVGFLGIVRGVLYLIGSDGKVQFTTDGKAWRYSGEATTNTLVGTAWHGMNSLDMDVDFLPGLDSNGPLRYYTHPLDATSETEGFVTVTATKPGEEDITRALPVRRGAVQQGGRAFRAVPFSLPLPSTPDGVVTDYSGATVTAYAEFNGGDETALWTWTWAATNMTPSSGSTNVATFTAMSSGSDTGTVTFTASRAGYGSVSGTVGIVKAKGGEGSGPRIGAGYAVLDAANTLIGVRFNTDGTVDVKRGSGGSYTRLTQWTGAVVAGVGSSYWLYVDPKAGTHALSTGTEDTWLALSSARTFEMSDATSGTHKYEADVYIGTSSAGANAVAGTFSMTLLVP